MHGRLKVRTTAEQQEAKRKEREKKLKIYNAATEKAFEKRKNKEYDKEALEITGEILGNNPDFNSLWNFRREVLTFMKEKGPEDEFQAVMENELQFIERCLRVNPKSYSSWHQRCFVLGKIPSPDWKTELHLCNKFLEYDERNFHCWDYRRFVVGHSKVSPEEEFTFTTDKISSNFSNFSSWHYRSKLLPLLKPDPDHPVGISEDALLEEYELVQNAFFTDPSDQSAWFYHKWLLGRATNELCLQLLYVSRESKKAVVVLSKPVKVGSDCTLHIRLNDSLLCHPWTSPSHEEYSQVWECSLDVLHKDTDVKVELQLDENQCVECLLNRSLSETWWKQAAKSEALFSSELSAVTSTTLTQELESIEQLHDMEPDNKWVLLTIISLMRALDPLKYEKQTLEYLEKLLYVDAMRTNYYCDLKSKYLVENALMKLEDNCRELDLSGLQLTCIPHTEHMVLLTSLDLRSNRLTTLPDLSSLQCLRHIKLDNNSLTSLDNLKGIPGLLTVTARDNSLESKRLDLGPSVQSVDA